MTRALVALACVLCCTSAAHADGAMVVRERTLFRTGPDSRGYCEIDSTECEVVLTKVLSGFGYLRGALRAGAAIQPQPRRGDTAFGALHIDGVSGALPGGEMAAASLDGVLGSTSVSRLRLTLLDFENVFVCQDDLRGGWGLPFLGMTSRHCRGDAVFGIDLRALRLQWDALDDQLMAEWLSLGPAFELLGNGLGQAHLTRSIVVGVPFDVSSRYLPGESGSGTTLGGSLRLGAFYRTPHWESRVRVRHRTSLVGGRGFAREHSFDGELRFLRNWFVTDGIAMQAGVSVGVSWASQPWLSQALIATRDTQLTVSAGLYLGWVSEAPSI